METLDLFDVEELSVVETPDAHADLTNDDDILELQHVTKAFLTDKHNEEYVATPDDIVELEHATIAFLADRRDGECFCLNDTITGLLLPGEQFILPASTAVDLARGELGTSSNVVDYIDEFMHAQMSLEDTPNTPLLDAAFETIGVSKMQYTSFDDVLGPNHLPQSLPTNERAASVLPSEFLYGAYDDPVDLADDLNPQLDPLNGFNGDKAEDKDSHLCAETYSSDMPLDASEAFSFSQASSATTHFDAHTANKVRYASFNFILQMDAEGRHFISGRRGQKGWDEVDVAEEHNKVESSEDVPAGAYKHTAVVVLEVDEVVGAGEELAGLGEWHAASNEEAAIDSDEDTDNDEEGIVDLHDFYLEYVESSRSSTTRSNQHGRLKVVTELPTIPEETDLSSAASNLSMDFANHLGFVKTLSARRESFLDDEEEGLATLPSNPLRAADIMDAMWHEATMDSSRNDLSCSHTADAISTLFANDVWSTEPDLEFAIPLKQASFRDLVNETELELFETLTAVFEIIGHDFWTDIPSFGAQLKRKLRRLMDHSPGLVSERLNEFIDLTVDYMAALDRSD